MAVDGSALVLVRPDDSIDSIARKVHETGSSSVQLLVPDNTLALQGLGGFERLRKSLGRDRIDLMIISSDEKTLNAARLNHLDTMGVQGARVTMPPDDGGQANPYATQVLRTVERDPRKTAPIPAQDAEFLDALDQVPAKQRYSGLDQEDADLYSALDDLSETIEHSAAADRRGRSADDEFAATLDEWSEVADEGRARPRSSFADDLDSTFDETGTGGRRRVRPEDIDVSPDELRRQRRGRREENQRARAHARETAPLSTRRRPTAGRVLDLEEYEEAAPRRRSVLRMLLPLIILLLLILAAVLLYRNMRATIEIVPATASVEHRYEGEVIPLSPGGADQSATAVQALAVDAEATFSTQGQVLSETLSPVGKAKGAVTIINTVEQPFPLPEGTQFLGTNAAGQEVRFVLDAPATIPPAVTTRSISGISTSYGQIDVPITARSAGSASNVGENAITQILIEGQQPYISDQSSFLIRHGPIGGGDEQPVRIVTEADVQQVLGEALTGLYHTGVQELRGKIDETQAGIDETTIHPNPEELANPESYEEPVVEPPIGQPVDPNNPTFTVTVRSRFNALATPRDNPVAMQLQSVVSNHLTQKLQGQPPCNRTDAMELTVPSQRWDGTRLTVDAVLTCTPTGDLDPVLASKVKTTVLGQSREMADAGLQDLIRQGLIEDYKLPENKDVFPRFDFLVNVVPASTTAPAQGTQ